MPWPVIARLAFMFVLVAAAYLWIASGGSLDVARYVTGTFDGRVEAATSEDAPRIVELSLRDRQILEGQRRRADEIARDVTYLELNGRLRDLDALQQIVDRGAVPEDDRYGLQSLGVALGDVMASELGLEWVVYEDDVRPSRALRVPGTDQLVFPVTMISKRVERGVPVDVRELFESAREIVDERIGPRIGDMAWLAASGRRPPRAHR